MNQELDERLDENQRAEAIKLVESVPWGDTDAYIREFEMKLALALEATCDALEAWETPGETRFGDEHGVSAEDVAELDAESRLAYVACLLQSMALAYGVDPWALQARTPDGGPVPPLDLACNEGTLAPVVRGLNDIVDGPGLRWRCA